MRRLIAPGKEHPDNWIATHRAAHGMGMPTHCTMLYGHVENYEERVDHLLRLRDLQDETGGFLAFIPLPFHPENTVFERRGWRFSTGYDDLKMIAVSRLMLDNFANIKAYWIMISTPLAQIALHYGAERHPGHGDGGEDRPRRGRGHAAGGEDAGPGGTDPRRRPGARCSATRSTTSVRRFDLSLRLGRISYANMAPVFYDLEASAFEQVAGRAHRAEREADGGEIDVAPICSIEYARNADRLRLLPQLCVSTEGAVDSIQLITRKPLEQVRSVAVTPESATSVVLTRVLLGDVDLVPLDQPADATHADRRRRAAQRVRRSDAALRPGPAVAGAHRTADGVRRLGLPRRRGRGPRGAGARPPALAGSGPLRAGGAGPPRLGRVRLAGRLPAPATSRSCATTSAPASGRGWCGSSSWRTWPASWMTVPPLRFVEFASRGLSSDGR